MTIHRSIWGAALIALALSTTTAQAQADLTAWADTWFKLSGQVRGVRIVGTRTRPGRQGLAAWFHLTTWDAGAQQMSAEAFFRDDTVAGWRSIPLTLASFGGGTLDATCVGTGTANGTSVALVVRLRGSLAGATIGRATIATLAGYELAVEGDERIAASLSFTGKRVDAGKVPVPHAARTGSRTVALRGEAGASD